MCPARMSKLEVAIRIVLDFHAAFNRHAIAEMLQFMTGDCVIESQIPAPVGAVYAGHAGAARYFQQYFQTSPQLHREIEEVFSSGFRCVVRWRNEWLDAAGDKQHLRGIDIFRVKDNLICEILSYIKA